MSITFRLESVLKFSSAKYCCSIPCTLAALAIMASGCSFGVTEADAPKKASKEVDAGDGLIVPGKVPAPPAPAPVPMPGNLTPPLGSWDDPTAATEPAIEAPAASQETAPAPELQASLYEYLTSVCGVRLPLSNSNLTLDSAIGRSELTQPLPVPVAPGISEFAREILISVSRREIFVNGYKVADVVCTDAKGLACTADTPLESGVLSVKSETGAGRRHPYLILPLLKQLEYFQKARLALLRHLDDKAYSWLLTCDVVSIAADRDVTYGLLAQVIHTAAMADLSRVRLVVTDESETLAYIPLLSPRSSREVAQRMALVGESQGPESALWPVDWLAVSPSEVAESFVAGPDPTLPGCLPEVDWTTLLADRVARAELYREWTSHVALVAASHAAILGLASPEGPIGLPVPPATVPGSEVPSGAPGSPVPAAVNEGANVDVAAAGNPEVPGPAKPLVPYLFMRQKEYALVLRTPEGENMQHVTIPRSQPGELYGHLERSNGMVLNLGPHPQVSVKDLVAALDAIRYRCPLYTMSGKCRRWEPFFPWVYLFVVPNVDFEAAVQKLLIAPVPEVPAGAVDGTEGRALEGRRVPNSPSNTSARGDGGTGKGTRPVTPAKPTP